MHNRVFLALACVLLILRLPSLVQPMGADQGLYAYVGERILAGELPYRSAWDQKPPAIHYTYAALRAAWPDDSVVPAADLLVAALVATLLLALGTALVGPGTGQCAALLLLFLSDPSFHRLAGVAVRAQCETFIAALVTGAFLLLAGSRDGGGMRKVLAAGVLFGAAAAFKYNAGAYAGAGLLALWLWKKLTPRTLAALVGGAAIVPVVMVLVFAIPGSLSDLYDATITYNVRYSGETYEGLAHFAQYLLTFPVQHARVDGLWLLGGAGCAVLLVAGRHQRERLFAPVWVAASCAVIAVNGSRGLPQYFVQALPALALSAAWAGSLIWTRRRMVNAAGILVVALAVWRVNEFSNLGRNVSHDAQYAFGKISRDTHLARYGDPDQRKYSAQAMKDLAEFIRGRSAPADTIYIFGFSGAAYVDADRASASRFFWSRPVIVDFNAHKTGYGVAGLREDLDRSRPVIVALQLRDWAPDVQDSAAFFMSTPTLSNWLRAGYDPVDGPRGYAVWQRR